ncbi:hypothetical protein M8494_20220 [Serratia ureilytica]
MAILQNGDVCFFKTCDCTLHRLPLVRLLDVRYDLELWCGTGRRRHRTRYASELFYPASMQMLLDNYQQTLHGNCSPCPASTAQRALRPLCEREQHWLQQFGRPAGRRFR